jgi:hypothetical protein
MKLTKKAASLILAASLAVSVCATPVFATATTPEMGPLNVNGTSSFGIGVGHTSVLYKVTESYSWSVPTTIDFGKNAGVGNTSTVEANLSGSTAKGQMAEQEAGGKAWKGNAPRVEVTKNVIGVGKKLQITVDTGKNNGTSYKDGKFYVEVAGTNEELYFDIYKPAAGGNRTNLSDDKYEVLAVPSGTDTSSQDLLFVLNTAEKTANVAEKAGEYKGTVVFSSKIVD